MIGCSCKEDYAYIAVFAIIQTAEAFINVVLVLCHFSRQNLIQVKTEGDMTCFARVLLLADRPV